MTVQEFECQIAKSQIGRYLGGEDLSETALGQLEVHLKECLSCRTALTERRQALQRMLLSESIEPRAVVHTESSAPAKTPESLAAMLQKKLLEQQALDVAAAPAEPTPPPATPSSMKKPLLYTVALAGVLLGMSYISKYVLGPGTRVSETLPVQATSPEPLSTHPAPETLPVPAIVEPAAEETVPASDSGQALLEPTPEPVQTPPAHTPAVSQAPKIDEAPTPPQRAASRPAPARPKERPATRPTESQAPAQNGIRVYLDDKPIQP